MTTIVKVDAHCGLKHEVRVKLYDHKKVQIVQDSVLQDTQSQSYHVYGDLLISVREVKKPTESEQSE